MLPMKTTLLTGCTGSVGEQPARSMLGVLRVVCVPCLCGVVCGVGGGVPEFLLLWEYINPETTLILDTRYDLGPCCLPKGRATVGRSLNA